MNFEPQKFFIGLVDFFSILLPGALLTYLLKDEMGPWILGQEGYTKLTGTEETMVFLFSSYLFGHFLFLVGSLLDNFLYDPIRNGTDDAQIKRLLQGRKLSPRFVRWLASLFFKSRADTALDRVVSIKEGYLKRIEAPNAINAFQWCKLRMAKDFPEALVTVNRFEADSKFFRSFCPVLFVFFSKTLYCCITTKSHALATESLILLVLVCLALWRYMGQRFKSTQQAYWAILTLEADSQKRQTNADRSDSSNSGEHPAGPTQVGGVVYREGSKKGVEYLLVEAKENLNLWVLPKAHIEPNEDACHCAIRGVKEETGVWAKIKKAKHEEKKIEKEVEFEVVEDTSENKQIRVRFYLMEPLGKGKPSDRRKHKWLRLPLNKAEELATDDNTKKLIALADQKIPELRKLGGH